MDDAIYLLDFEKGTVTPVDASTPPEYMVDSARQRKGATARVGYTLAALGSPPVPDED